MIWFRFYKRSLWFLWGKQILREYQWKKAITAVVETRDNSLAKDSRSGEKWPDAEYILKDKGDISC